MPWLNQLVEHYTKAKIFNLGIRVQCSVCEQRSWHPLEAMRSEIECPICLSRFPVPIHNPRDELKWSYKSLGPFALPKQGFGAYSVLMTVRFLSTHQHPATTPVLSFRARQNSKELEADFMERAPTKVPDTVPEKVIAPASFHAFFSDQARDMAPD